jgi:hypothetical protein
MRRHPFELKFAGSLWFNAAFMQETDSFLTELFSMRGNHRFFEVTYIEVLQRMKLNDVLVARAVVAAAGARGCIGSEALFENTRFVFIFKYPILVSK